MSIFDTILSSLRSLVGGERAEESEPSPGETTPGESGRSEGTVSVERDPDRDATDASTESVIKGTDETETESTDAGDDGEADEDEADASSAEGVAAETDAAASTETLVDEAAGQEPAEAVAPTETPEDDADADDEAADDEAAADRTADDSDTEADAGSESAEEPSEPVETLKGIGPAYAERLGSIGIESVADLAAADPEEVADGIDVSEKRVSGWVDRAKDES